MVATENVTQSGLGAEMDKVMDVAYILQSGWSVGHPTYTERVLFAGIADFGAWF
jgi:hypothetical protein